MKLRSIQFKFLITVISAMLAVTVLIGGLSVYEVDGFIQRRTENLINAMCDKEALQINDVFGGMEKSVKIMESYVLDFVEDGADIEDRQKQQEIIAKAEEMFPDIVEHTEGVVAYYMRFAPEISDGKTGMFYSKTNDSDEYISFEPTDIYAYDKNDTEHVGWFWQPYEAGKPVWMKPYYNQNNDILMISYVVPMYFEKQFVGIVGMDFDYRILTDKVSSIKIYDNGFAQLEMDEDFIRYVGDETVADAKSSSDKYLRVSRELENGMRLVLLASYDDIWQIRYEIMFEIFVVVLLMGALFSIIAFFVVRKVVDPLKKLTEASKKLSEGDYDVEIAHSDTYEIKLLSTAFENMTISLREHEKHQKLLVYHDSLTGLRNTTAYAEWVADFEKDIQNGDAEFGVLMLDLNYLKETNDIYGHNVGNSLIVTASQIISSVFRRSPAFRIGGDEFVVIIQNRDLNFIEELLRKIDEECAKVSLKAGEDEITVSIAKGLAIFDAENDDNFMDVFNRADENMYIDKRKMKNIEE